MIQIPEKIPQFGRTVSMNTMVQLETQWEHVPYGFTKLQSQLNTTVGLFAAREGDGFTYIGCAIQPKGGLRAGLARGRLKLQTGNNSYGMTLVRKSLDRVEAYILTVDKVAPFDDVHTLEDLKWSLINKYKPDMNAPRDIVTAAKRAAAAR